MSLARTARLQRLFPGQVPTFAHQIRGVYWGFSRPQVPKIFSLMGESLHQVVAAAAEELDMSIKQTNPNLIQVKSGTGLLSHHITATEVLIAGKEQHPKSGHTVIAFLESRDIDEAASVYNLMKALMPISEIKSLGHKVVGFDKELDPVGTDFNRVEILLGIDENSGSINSKISFRSSNEIPEPTFLNGGKVFGVNWVSAGFLRSAARVRMATGIEVATKNIINSKDRVEIGGEVFVGLEKFLDNFSVRCQQSLLPPNLQQAIASENEAIFSPQRRVSVVFDVMPAGLPFYVNWVQLSLGKRVVGRVGKEAKAFEFWFRYIPLDEVIQTISPGKELSARQISRALKSFRS